MLLFVSACFSIVSAQMKNPTDKDSVQTIVQVGHTSPIINYDVSADGRYLVSTDMIRNIIVWDLKR